MQDFMKSLETLDGEKVSKTRAKISFRFSVLHEYLNHAKDFHGGSLGMTFDILSAWSLFLIASPYLWRYPWVKRALSYIFLDPVKGRETVLAEGEVSIGKQNGWIELRMLTRYIQTVHLGKRLALLKATIGRERDGATCAPERYNTVPPQPKL